jgi:hypothetical protein
MFGRFLRHACVAQESQGWGQPSRHRGANRHSVLARFHQAPAGISQANGIAVFNKYPASRDCKLDCVRGLPVDLSRHAPVQRLAVCRVVQDTQHAKR